MPPKIFPFDPAEIGWQSEEDRVDDAVLALLLLGLRDGVRAWKGSELDLSRPHEDGRKADI